MSVARKGGPAPERHLSCPVACFDSDEFVTPTTSRLTAKPSGAAQGPLSHAVGLLRIKVHCEIKSALRLAFFMSGSKSVIYPENANAAQPPSRSLRG